MFRQYVWLFYISMLFSNCNSLPLFVCSWANAALRTNNVRANLKTHDFNVIAVIWEWARADFVDTLSIIANAANSG